MTPRDVRRRFTMAAGLEGRVHLRGELDPTGGEYLRTALVALMNGDRPTGDLRCHAERQGDALVALARGALDGGTLPDVRGERPHVRVTIDWQSLCAARGTVGGAGGELGWAGPITPEAARGLACDASVVRIITGPDGLPLDVGRAQRTASAAIRRAVELRDGRCVFAACDALPEWCDVGLPRSGGHHSQRQGRRGKVPSWVGSIRRSSAIRSSPCIGATVGRSPT